MTKLRVLGPLEIVGDGSSGPAPGPRETALLALLAARYPRPAGAAELLEDLWGPDPAAGAETTLRSYVSTLRRALRQAGHERVVATVGGGYALCTAVGETLDARVFQSLLRHAERLRDAGDPGPRINVLGAALGLWRGPAFAEVRFAPGVAPHALYLEEARLAATEEWVQARLHASEHVALSAELATLCAEQPLRERLWELRMLALYRSGRQADALSAYRRLHDQLRDELGIEPGERLRALELAILRQDPALERSPAIDPAASAAPAGPAGPAAVPDPTQPSPAPVVGRDGQLSELEVAWALAQERSATPVLIVGEPGIGKSALARAFAERLARRGVRVLAGGCRPRAQAPYQPFRDALAPLLSASEAPALARWGAGRGAGGDRAAGSLHERAPDPETGSHHGRAPDPETARLELFELLGDAVCAAARAAPLLIVIEDLHWADASSLLLARHLASRAHGEAVLVVLTCRDTEIAPGSPLEEVLAELRQSPGATTLRLSGLSEGDVLALLAAGRAPAPGDPDRPELAALLHRATEGNPLYLRQMLAQLALTPEAFITETGTLVPDPPLPAGVRDAIARRLALLAPETAATLTLAAIIGPEFDLDLLSALEASEQALTSLARAQRAGLVVEQAGERFRFVHELVRRSLYEQLGAAARARLHGRVAEALERLADGAPGSLAALADHFAAAARPGATAKAVSCALAAGRLALSELAFAEAAAFAQRGLECLALERAPSIEQRCELLLLLAQARLLARDIQGCRDAAVRGGEDARRLGDADRLTRAAIVGSQLNAFARPSEATRRLCEDALAAVGDDDLTTRAQILAGFADYVASSEGDAPAAERLSERALALARDCEDPAALARALFVHAEVLGWSPRIEQRLALGGQLRALGLAHRDRRAQAGAHHVRALALLESGDARGFDAEVAAIERLRPRLDYWYIDMYLLLWRGMRALMDGRYDEVERNAGELLAYARHEPNVVNLYAGQLSWLRREQGRLGELRPLVQDAIRHSPDVAGFRCGLAVIHADLGELDLAADQLHQLARDGFAALPRDATWTTSLALLAEVAAVVGDRRLARALGELLLPHSGTLIVATKGMACAGAADRFLGLLAAARGEHALAERLLRSALALESRVGAEPLIARTRACLERAIRA